MTGSVDGRKKMFAGKNFNDLTYDEKLTKYGTTRVLEGRVANAISNIEKYGKNRALEMAKDADKVSKECGVSGNTIEEVDVKAKVKIVARKLLLNKELSVEENDILLEYGDLVDKEIARF